MRGVLVLMGSGETTPTMTSTHRKVVERLGKARCVMLDTPFGFQENWDQIVDKTAEYFQQSVGQELGLAHLKAADVPPLELETAMTRLREANYIFAGPGSPTYALRQWKESPVPAMLVERLNEGAAVVFASAAACTLGSHCLPVYEIYKVGQELHWLEGLGLMEKLGLPFVVLPHFNNTEGQGHDTRFCYMGERRLRLLEELLPEETYILGLDEHTGCTLDLEARRATVSGRGGVTVRRRGQSRFFGSGTSVDFEELWGQPAAAAVPEAPPAPAEEPESQPFPAMVSQLEDKFEEALRSRRADRAVAVMLDLEQLMTDWANDTDPLYRGRARSLLRGQIVRLGEEALEGLRDPADRLRPFVALLLNLRERARRERQWALADEIRDVLVKAGLEVHDTPQGTSWELAYIPQS